MLRKTNHPCIEAYDRKIIVVWVPGRGRQPFYQSTGRCSEMPGQWLPFDGVLLDSGWFIKNRYRGTDPGTGCEESYWPLHRFGLPILKAVSEALAETNFSPQTVYPRGEYPGCRYEQQVVNPAVNEFVLTAPAFKVRLPKEQP